MLSRYQTSARQMPWRKRAFLAMFPSAAAWRRTSHTSTTSMMFGISPNGWSKKLTNKAKQKGCEEMVPWIQSISNHLWWCSATCDGNVQLLREKWKSVLDQVVNKDKWSGNTLFHQCFHRRISSSEAKQICWLKPGSQAHIALEEVVLIKSFLKIWLN